MVRMQRKQKLKRGSRIKTNSLFFPPFSSAKFWASWWSNGPFVSFPLRSHNTSHGHNFGHFNNNNNNNESLLSHKINNHISYVTTLKEGIYINYRENQDKNYKTRLCLKTKRLTNVFLNLSVFILGW